jgi:outer membrane protein TolC
MRKLKTGFLLGWILSLTTHLVGQDVDLTQAIAIGLENNYDIKIAIYNYEIDQNNADPGNSGFFPTLFLQGNGAYSNEDIDITFTSPEQPGISANGASTINYGASANLEYLLFNGGRRMHIYNQFQSISEDGRLNQRLAMENTSLQVAQNFLEAIRLSDQVKIDQQSVELSLDRLERASQNYSFGNTTKLQLLNAEVDLRTDSINLANTTLELNNSLRRLYLVMGLPADTSLTLSNEFAFRELLNKDELLNEALTGNTNYLRSRNAVITAEEQLKANKSDLWPTLSANAAYQYGFTDFEANFLNTQENLGWNAGVALRFNIFDGARIQRGIENARLQTEIAKVNEERNRNQVVQLVNSAYETYITNLDLLKISERNLDLAQTNFDRSTESFSSGQITGVELRAAQLNLNNALTAISRQRVITKIAEIGLLYEAGILLE